MLKHEPRYHSRNGRHADKLAFFAALIWLVHPVQTQAVTYIVQRLASLSAMLFLASFTFFLKGLFTFDRLYRVGQGRTNGLIADREYRYGDGQHRRNQKILSADADAIGELFQPFLHA